MLVGIDDTDSPRGMCTTYLGAVLAKRLQQEGISVLKAVLVRLNPNVPWKTRGNAAICLEAVGDTSYAFRIACDSVEEFAEFSAEQTNPGVVVAAEKPPVEFYYRALRDYCSIEEAYDLLQEIGALYRGYKNGRGLIGALAAVCHDLPDQTFELLAYRDPSERENPRKVDRQSFFTVEHDTFPHTWDTVDRENNVVVCVPHTPDPVLFGIRGESPLWVQTARDRVRSTEPVLEQVYVTNQGTDAHLVAGEIGDLREGISYCLAGTVASRAATARGGHVRIQIRGGRDQELRCMAFEPTKGFRDIVRSLLPEDRVMVTGSYKKGSLNLEKICLLQPGEILHKSSPRCCDKKMTSAGTGKGYKCRKCGRTVADPEYIRIPGTLAPGWYEVPSCARRHLAKPLCRGPPSPVLINRALGASGLSGHRSGIPVR